MPAIVSARQDGGFHLWLVDLDHGREALERAERAVPRLSAEEIARGQGIADLRQGARWRAARIALRIALERVSDETVRRKPFVLEAQGRPVLPGNSVVFSLAHTMSPDAAHALIAVATSGPLGCDIEREREIAMSAERLARLRLAGEALAPRGRASCGDIGAWVRLEALGKADGRGVWPVLDAAGVHGVRDMTAGETAVGVRGLAGALGVAVADVVLPAPLRGAVAAPPRMLGGLAVAPRGLDDLLTDAT